MANQVCNFSDLIHRVTASCLLLPLAQEHELKGNSEDPAEDEEYEEDQEESSNEENDDKRKGEREDFRVSGENKKVMEMEILMGEMFDSVSSLKRAYINLQEAHHPWNPDKLRLADVAMVAELKRLGCLKERFRRRAKGGGKSNLGPIPLCEVVAPYEASMEDLKREIRAKDVELETLKEKLHNVSNFGKKGRTQSKRKINSNQIQVAVAAVPPPEMFEATMSQVKEASKSFTSHLLTLMRSSRWDLTAAVRSIEAASGSDETTASIVGAHHAKYALESYIYRKIFHGFDHETFYMDGSLSSLLNPDQFRRNCFTQYRDMKAMNPTELLGILPTCHFGKFCSTKFISILHEKMEESLFGNLEQRRQILAGNHPRSQFYGEFLTLAKAVWLLHLLAFALDPAPSHFQAVKGGAFQADCMESVVRFSGGRVPVGQIVGFPISPGFKLGNGSVIKSRVYLVSRE